MSKKILKRSLALGALMAFVITGSAYASEPFDFSKVYPTDYRGDSYGYPYINEHGSTMIDVTHKDEFKSWYDFKDKPFGLEEKYYPGEQILVGDDIVVQLDSKVGFNANKADDVNKYSSYLKTDLNGHNLIIEHSGSDSALSGSGVFSSNIVYNYDEMANDENSYYYKHIYENLVGFNLDLPGFNIYDSTGTGDLEIISSNTAIQGYGTINVDKLKITNTSNYAIFSTLDKATGEHNMKIYANSIDINTGGYAFLVNNDLDIVSTGALNIQGKDDGNYSRPIRVAHGATANITAETLNIKGGNTGIKVDDEGKADIANSTSTLNITANSGIIDSNVTAGTDDYKGIVNLTLGSGVTLTGSVVTNDISESASNITLNGATWKITGDSNISTLAGNDGKIVLALREKAEQQAVTYALARTSEEEKEFFTLQIGDASDSGAEVTGEGLTEKVESGELTAEEALEKLSESVTVDEGSATLTIEEGDTVGATSATISADGMSTVKQAVNTKAAKVSKAATNLKAHYRAHMNDMNKRMGELRMANGEAGVWTRMVRGESEYEGAKMQYNQYQLGYDEKLSVDKRWTVGAAVTFAEGDGSYGQGSTDDKSTAFAIYGTKLNNDGTFVDLIARYAHLESDMEDSVYGNGDYSTNGYSVSAEFGKRIQQGKGLWIEPQVELTYGTIDSANFRLKNGREEYNANFDSMDSFIARVGFSIGKDIKEGNVYARASYLYDFDGETTSLVTKNGIGTPTPEDFGGGWWEVGVGANINLSKATYIYADIEKTFGGEVDTNWQWNLGVRYSF